jgi:hypothetical protein
MDLEINNAQSLIADKRSHGCGEPQNSLSARQFKSDVSNGNGES